ncbi:MULTISPECIES: methyl-accepting chemotaxis protein [Marinobacter]|nr:MULTISPECIES: methyl-accepting chemotaxis protein [Marinobacter]UZD64976.1 methyl-accepting chemotaxis protein [Marinobacter sp. AN1]
MMRSLSFRKKFAVIAVVFLVPMLIISTLLLKESADSRQFTTAQRAGLQDLILVRDVLEKVQEHRGMSAAYLNGASQFATPLQALQTGISQSLSRLEMLRFPQEQLVSGLENDWHSLTKGLEEMTPAESFRRHVDLVEGLFSLIDRIGEQSNLILDPSPDTYYLITLVTSSYPGVVEMMGQARGVGVGVAARGKHTDNSQTRLIALSSQIQRDGRDIQHNLQRAESFRDAESNELGVFSREADLAIKSYIGLLEERLIQPGSRMASPDEIVTLATEAITTVYDQFDELVPLVDRALGEREANATGVFNLTLTVLVVVLLSVAYLFTTFYLSVRSGISALMATTSALARGDLTHRVSSSGKDELAEAGASLNDMADEFQSIIRQVSQSAEQTAQASEELSAVTEESAEGVGRQKRETEQVASAMTELSATVREVAENTGKAAEAAGKANQQATEGQQLINRLTDQISDLAEALRKATDSVNSLNGYSQEIGSVVDVINDIAEQTNLLALNAAIEAARAGDNGRGFAVVADEVRSLAKRTQTSTAQIHQSIQRLQSGSGEAVSSMEHSLSESDASVDMVRRTRQAFVEILASVDLISEMGTQIASATEQQSSVSSEMNANIEQIAEVAEQTATSTGQVAQASENLSELAQNLSEQIARFQTE